MQHRAKLKVGDFDPMGAKMSLEWELPAETVDKAFAKELTEVVKEEVTLRLFSEGKISSGYAASLLGMTRREFLALLKKRSIPFVRYLLEDLKADQRALERARKQAASPPRKCT